MNLNKKELKTLIKEVVLPVSKEFENIKKTELDNELKLKHRHLLAYLAVTLLSKPEYAEDRFIQSINEKSTLGDLEYDELKKILEKFFSLLKNFAHNMLDERLNYYYSFFLEAYKHKTNKEIEEEFFDLSDNEEFDGFDADYVQKSMHYKDEEKISAEEFMQKGYLDEEIIVEIEEMLDEYFKIATNLNIKEDKFFLVDLISKFAYIFEISVEFRNISLGLYDLAQFLKELDVSSLNEDEIKLLESFLDSIMEDLNKWFKEVVLEKSAKDIHYLDASLVSSIEQLKIFFKVNKKIKE